MPSTADTQASFLADIIANPADDTPRLIYSDWLEEQGEENRAEFVRVQVEIANLDPYHLSCMGRKCPVCSDLKRRERYLMINHAPGGLRDTGWGVVCSDRFAELCPRDNGLEFRRGLPWKAICPCDAWLEHGPALVWQHPLERVELSDKEPDEFPIGSGAYTWWDPAADAVSLARNVLPLRLWNRVSDVYVRRRLKECSREQAVSALSEGCLDWARQPFQIGDRVKVQMPGTQYDGDDGVVAEIVGPRRYHVKIVWGRIEALTHELRLASHPAR